MARPKQIAEHEEVINGQKVKVRVFPPTAHDQLMMRDGLPSAADLDAVSDERRIWKSTSYHGRTRSLEQRLPAIVPHRKPLVSNWTSVLVIGLLLLGIAALYVSIKEGK